MSININMNDNSNEVENLNNIEKIFMDFINQFTLCVCIETEIDQEQVTMAEISNNSTSKYREDCLIDGNSSSKKSKSNTISKKNINDEEWIHLD